MMLIFLSSQESKQKRYDNWHQSPPVQGRYIQLEPQGSQCVRTE